MSKVLENKSIAAIGAEMSGITLAKKLSTSNEVTVFDKSRGMAERIMARRAYEFSFDHGAQFFTEKSNEFKEFCQKANDYGIIEEWKCRFVEIIGIMSVTVICFLTKICKLPKGENWSQYYVMSLITGIGFTMSLFIETLAFDNIDNQTFFRLGVILGSLISGISGYILLRIICNKKEYKNNE
jgi:hypothetical protein